MREFYQTIASRWEEICRLSPAGREGFPDLSPAHPAGEDAGAPRGGIGFEEILEGAQRINARNEDRPS